MALISDMDVYALLGESGVARIHVSHIDQLRRVDAVPVVRCKNCKHWQKPYWCKRDDFGGWVVMYHYDFCSKGDSKDGKDGDVDGRRTD